MLCNVENGNNLMLTRLTPVTTLIDTKQQSAIRLQDVRERQELSLNLLSKLVLSLIVGKHLVVLEYFPVSLKILE